jgi:hypothetical protein
LILSTAAIEGKRYTAETSVFQSSNIQEDIDIQIKEAQGPLFIRRLFLNKPMYIINTLRENYLRTYSPEFLFLSTEPSKIFSIWSRGRIYFLDLVFIILGIGYLYKINRKGALFVTLITLVAGLPGAFVGFPYSGRNFLIAIFLPILTASGILWLLNLEKVRKLKVIILILLIVSYTYEFGSYLFDYYGRFALYGSEAWAKSLKDVSLLIEKEKSSYDKVIVGQTSLGDFIQYAFYTKLGPLEVQQVWQKKEKQASGDMFSVDKIAFIPGCISKKGDAPYYSGQGRILYIVHNDCHPYATPSGQIKDFDGNTVWKIFKLGK